MESKSLYQDLSGYTPTWCPGCGDWGIVRAIKLALEEQGLGPDSILVAFDIGCSGNMNDFLNAYSMHTLHGRSIASAIGMKLGHHTLPVLAIGGDGALYGEGGNHFLHACRGNHDITVIAHDNMVYGLTTGQVAPTANKGFKSRSTPNGVIEIPANPLALAITQGATFVAQGFANEVLFTKDLIRQAMEHKGMSLVNIIQPCVTFNRVNTYQYFLDRVYKLDENHDKANINQAITKSLEPQLQEKFPLGVIYESSARKAYHEEVGVLAQESLATQARNEKLTELFDMFI